MDDDRLITSSMLAEDENCEFSLRPRFLAEYIGQGNVKEHALFAPIFGVWISVNP